MSYMGTSPMYCMPILHHKKFLSFTCVEDATLNLPYSYSVTTNIERFTVFCVTCVSSDTVQFTILYVCMLVYVRCSDVLFITFQVVFWHYYLSLLYCLLPKLHLKVMLLCMYMVYVPFCIILVHVCTCMIYLFVYTCTCMYMYVCVSVYYHSSGYMVHFNGQAKVCIALF